MKLYIIEFEREGEKHYFERYAKGLIYSRLANETEFAKKYDSYYSAAMAVVELEKKSNFTFTIKFINL